MSSCPLEVRPNSFCFLHSLQIAGDRTEIRDPEPENGGLAKREPSGIVFCSKHSPIKFNLELQTKIKTNNLGLSDSDAPQRRLAAAVDRRSQRSARRIGRRRGIAARPRAPRRREPPETGPLEGNLSPKLFKTKISNQFKRMEQRVMDE